MEIKFEKKFSEKHIDGFMNSFYKNYMNNPSDSYIFDLIDTEWISNQGLLLITGVIKYLYSNNNSFEVIFIERGTSTLKVDYRKAKLIIQVWDIWQIWRLFSNHRDCERYIGITESYVTSLKSNFKINYSRPEIYDNYDITPFVLLDYQDEWNDDDVIEYLREYHRLNEATIDIVAKHNCAHPFITNLFGEIVSKELYENFLAHFGQTFFNANEDYAFFSVNLNGKFKDDYPNQFIQDKLGEHFDEEELPESVNFFMNKSTNEYYNRPFISYSFLDFGVGIVNTLRDECSKIYGNNISDSEILKFAFKHDSSRYPIRNIFEKQELKDFIPRGLFDVLSIVKRYRGLLIVRSCFGKILYDFSKSNTSIEDAFSTFGNAYLFFPGTFITLYLPAIQDGEEIDTSNITPILPNYSAKKEFKLINLKNIIEKVEKRKDKDKYTVLYSEIHSLLLNKNKTITFFSFDDVKGNQYIKKIIFFLVSSYDVNDKNNFVILNPPNKEFLNEINREIIMLSQISKNYKIHPLPFVYYDKEKNDISLYWLGIYNKDDIQVLNKNLLYNEFSLSKNNFKDKDNIIGHILSYDKFGNLISNLPNENTLKKVCENPDKFIKSITYNKVAKEIIQKIENTCISEEENSIYLCNGNYYQFKYIELTKLLMNKGEREIISNALFSLLEIFIDDSNFDKYKFIAITSSSHSIVNSWIESESNPIIQDNAIFLENYNDVSALDEKLPKEPKDYKYILVCDIIATGFLSERIENVLLANGCELDKIAVIVNSITPEFSKVKKWCAKNENKILSIHKYQLDRYYRDSNIVKPYIQQENEKSIIRINPYTNVPITQKISGTNIDKVIFEKEEFLKYIIDEYVQIGLLNFNNLLHPYFFNTKKIIKEIGIKLLDAIFAKGKINITPKNLTIFYPKKSDISELNFKAFKTILGGYDNSIYEYELERYITKDGWKFPHTTEYFMDIVKGNSVLILDDGSCTGNSLIQMINEVSYFSPRQIIVLCLIGRVGEHLREFLSLISELKRNGNIIDIEVFFGTHWHIPTYYSEDNPFINESNWFNKIKNDFPNTPSKIQRSISFIDKELKPQINRSDLKDYYFLPKLRASIESDLYSDKKGIINVRDEVGKIIDYRFYRESFDWFDKFMRKYESNEYREDRYKEIELLCAVIAYEPHLFEKIRLILPDVVEKLQEFIETIIWRNPQKSRKKLPMEDLTYLWDKRDIVNLLFIVFSSKDLRDKLSIDNFKELVVFSPSLNYILYKLLKYFPLKADFPKDEFDLFLKDMLKTLCNKENPNYLTDKKQRTEIKRYIRFLDTLPNRGDFDAQINTIRENYLKQENPDIHDEKISFNHNISGILVPIKDSIAYIRNGKEVVDAEIIRNYWFSILEFVNPIISFCTSYDRFLLPFPYDKLVRGKELRAIINEIESVIFSLTSSYKEIKSLELLVQNIYKLQSIIGNESDFKKLFISQMCTIEYIVTELYNKISELAFTYKIIKDNPKDNPEFVEMKCDTKIPKYYADKLIIAEIITNLKKYAQEGENSEIEIKTIIDKGKKTITLSIRNIKEKNNISNGNYEGTKCLEFLSDFSEFNFTYIEPTRQEGTQQYIQHLVFKTN